MSNPDYVIGCKQTYSESECMTVEELATYLAKIHKIPIEWFEEWRDKINEKYPIMKECPKANHAWIFTARDEWIMSRKKE